MPTRRRRRAKRRSPWRAALRNTGLGLIAVVLGVGGYVLYRLDTNLRSSFEGRRWSVPAHVYSRSSALYPGLRATVQDIESRLRRLGYRSVAVADRPGTWARSNGKLTVHVRGFYKVSGYQSPERVRLIVVDDRIASLDDYDGRSLSMLELEPQLIGSILPLRHEDRAPVRLHDVPEPLLKALLVMEDKRFLVHHGIDPRGIIRAMLQNLRAGRVVAGGSTLTQQLVKNLYLNPERSLRRKLTEAAMALLLEFHYGKNEILQAYVNEVFLGQSGNRAIHGFALASEHFFGRPLAEVSIADLALLVGMVKAPSRYNPIRFPERALARRNLVLKELTKAGHLDAQSLASFRKAPLNVASQRSRVAGKAHSFLDFVRRQVARDFDPDLLRAEGLRLYTTINLQVQEHAERVLAHRLVQLEQDHGLESGSLQGAVLVVRVETGEVHALVGGRDPRYAGFNRALDAARPAGSLLKPAVYLTALNRPDRYTLTTLLDDSEFELQQAGGPNWHPRNHDREDHDRPPLITALADSYNVATARLGLKLGIDNVIDTLHALGLIRDLKPYPSITLGAVALTPVEIAQMYQTLAAGGHQVRLRTVNWIGDHDGRQLARYPLKARVTVTPQSAYLLNRALREVILSGTASRLNRDFPPRLELAGKTGTTGGYRDSWFAGYAGNYLAVVWIGRDDNRPIGLSGASGALTVWAALMKQLTLTPVRLYRPQDVLEVKLDRTSLMLADEHCPDTLQLPFIAGSEPVSAAPCSRAVFPTRDASDNGIVEWWRAIWLGVDQSSTHNPEKIKDNRP